MYCAETKKRGRFKLENKRWNKDIFKLSNIPAALVLVLFIFSFSVAAALNFRPLYYLDIGFLDISGTSGYSEEEIRQNYDALIDYNNLTYTGSLEFPTMKMSDNARVHFEDVKRVFDAIELVLLISAPLTVFAAVWMRRRRQRGYLALASILTVGIPALLALLIAADWQSFFIRFHELVFSNDYWLFDPDEDPVITILPDEFFMHCAILILVLMVLGSLVCFMIYKRKGGSAEKPQNK